MRRIALLGLLLVVGCSGQATSVASGPRSQNASPRPVAAATGGIVEYAVNDVTPGCASPCYESLGSIALGPDGNMWYVDGGSQVVGRVTPGGKITQFQMPVSLAGGAQTIAAGPDRSVWVLGRGANAKQPDWVLRVGPNGDVTKFPTSIYAGTESIALGPDGNLWFTEFWTSRVARLTPTGTITEFSTPTLDAHPRGITTGPDGNLWFAEDNRAQPAIGRITPQGTLTEFSLGAPTDSTPNDIIAGPDGNLWFTRWVGSSLGRISPSGQFVVVALPDGTTAGALVAGPDGNIWFSDAGKNAIARLHVTGSIREFPMPARGAEPYGMAVGGDGRIWFSEAGGLGSIGVRVPEALISQRVLVFADATPKSVTVTNTGDATLTIGALKVAGVDSNAFVVRADSCSGKALNPGSTCEVMVSHSAGGAPGVVQSALLEVSDNGSGSPQKISLVAHLQGCLLPIVESLPNLPPQGSMLDTTTGRALYEPRGGFTTSASPARVVTVAEPALDGQASGYYDRAAGRWLPVANADSISPDGSRYTYVNFDPAGSRDLHVVDVATGRERVLPTGPGFWAVVAFTAQGIYLNQAYEGIGPGLWLVNPDTGSIRLVLASGAVNTVTGTTAWIGVRNAADTLPQWGMGGGNNEIDSTDLVSGASRRWLYVPGSYMYVASVYNGWPVVSIGEPSRSRVVVVTSPNEPTTLDLPFTNDRSPSLSGFVSDAEGLWIGSDDGVYLWSQRTGGILVSTVPARPAGTCV